MASIPKRNRTPLDRVPAVEVGGLAEVGVAAEADPPEAGPPAEGDRPVDVDMRLLVRRAVAAAIDQVERLAGVGQRDDQGMIAPGAVVGDVDALLALGVGGDEGAVDVHDRLAEEVGGLLGVDAQPGGVDGLHQVQDVGLAEAAAEVTFGGRVGDALGAEGIEIDLVVAAPLDVLEAAAAGEEVEGDVQDVVGLEIGEVALEEVEVGGRWRRSSPVRRATSSMAPMPPADEAVDAPAQFVVDVGGGDHGHLALGLGARGDAVEELPPALSQESCGCAPWPWCSGIRWPWAGQ